MKLRKMFKPYDYNFYDVPWGASVTLTPKGTVYRYKPAGLTIMLATGQTLIEVCTRSGFVAFGQLNKRTGREKVQYYEVLEDGRPVEVTEHYIKSEVLSTRYRVSKGTFLDGVPDRTLVFELEKRGYKIQAAFRHQIKTFTIEDE